VVTVDSPTDLSLQLDAGTVFLNYLYTREPYRGRSLAGELIRLACADLAAKGLRRCLAHIRATNHASLASFKKAGWTRCGRIISTTSGRFIAALGCEQSGLRVQPLNRA
jgi:L-amino acid N-acyltransferase YncA